MTYSLLVRLKRKQRKELVTVYNLHLEYDLRPIGVIKAKTKKRISHGIQPSSRV